MRCCVLLLATAVTLVAVEPATEPSTAQPDSASDAGPSEPVAADLPPSPGDPEAHPGLHIYDPPAFTHWPAVVYHDEERNAAFRIPIPPTRERDAARGIERGDGAYHNPFGWDAGASGSIGWADGEPVPFQLPERPQAEAVSGLVDLPRAPGHHRAELVIGDTVTELSLRLVPAGGHWPLSDLRNGFPVDAAGVPVVLIARRRDPGAAGRFSLLRAELPAAEGPVVLVGDPLAAPDGEAWPELPAATRLAVSEERRPHHAALVAIAGLGRGDCGTLLWSPGNGPLHAGMPTAEEERLLVAVEQRYAALGRMPDLVLLLPPLPLEERLQTAARERRDQLRRTATFSGWRIIDAADLAGDPEAATRFAAGLHSRYPTGAARERIAAALRRELTAAAGD